MSITITFSGDTPLEALSTITAFGMHCQCVDTIYQSARRILETEQFASSANPQPVADLPAEPRADEPPHDDPSQPPAVSAASGAKGSPAADDATSAPPAPSAASDANTRATAPVPKLEDIRAAGLKAAREHGQPAVKAILNQFGVANMTALAEQDRAPFMEALAKLGQDNNA